MFPSAHSSEVLVHRFEWGQEVVEMQCLVATQLSLHLGGHKGSLEVLTKCLLKLDPWKPVICEGWKRKSIISRLPFALTKKKQKTKKPKEPKTKKTQPKSVFSFKTLKSLLGRKWTKPNAETTVLTYSTVWNDQFIELHSSQSPFTISALPQSKLLNVTSGNQEHGPIS